MQRDASSPRVALPTICVYEYTVRVLVGDYSCHKSSQFAVQDMYRTSTVPVLVPYKYGILSIRYLYVYRMSVYTKFERVTTLPVYTTYCTRSLLSTGT